MDVSFQEIIGGLSIIISFAASLIYIISILRKKTRPHLYTWLIWTMLPAINFFAQLHEGAGPGAWASGATAAFCLIITVLCLPYGEKNIKRGDTKSLVVYMYAILPWVLTKDPLGSVILISLIDLIAFYPTFRKTWARPFDETLITYALGGSVMALSICALTVFNVTTLLYPAVFTLGNLVFIGFCLWRRSIVEKT